MKLTLLPTIPASRSLSGSPSKAWLITLLMVALMTNVIWGQSFWLKGDGDYSSNHWDDITINDNDAVLSGGTITKVTNSVNFNPSLSFTAIDRQMQIESSTSIRTFIIVAKPTNTNGENAGLIGNNDDKGIRLDVGTQSWSGDANADDWYYQGGSRINGASGFVHNYKWHIVNQYRGTAINSRFYVGGYYSSRSYTGNIAEVIAYSGTVSNQVRVESYLAVKYGISMGTTSAPLSYYASDGSTTWLASGTYQNDVHGIGRDDSYGLDQRSSKSENPGTDILILQSGTSFSTPANAQTGSALTNLQFFLTGHNGAGTSTFGDLATSIVYKVLPRIWYAMVTNNLPTESFQFDLTSTTIPSYCRMGVLVADNAALTTNLRFIEGNLVSGILTVNNLAITSGKYFTVAFSLIPAVPTVSNNGPVCDGNTVNLAAGGMAPASQAINFSTGSFSYINVPYSAPYNLSTNSTIEAWIYPTSIGGAPQNIIYNKENSYEAGINPDGTLTWAYNNTIPGWAWVNTGYYVPLNTWTHVAFVYDYTNLIFRTYINGAIVHTYSISGTVAGSVNPFRIGNRSANSPFFGTIDNVRIWNVARTAIEIPNSMNLEYPNGSTTGLIALYPLNGNADATVGANGTLVNAGGASWITPTYYTYTWSGTNAPAPSTSQTQTTGALSPGGNYSYTVIASAGSCSGTNSGNTTVTVNALPSFFYTKTNITCFNAGDGTITITASGGSTPYFYRYSTDGGSTWIGGGDGWTQFTNPSGNTQVISLLGPGTYTVELKDTNGCIQTQCSITP